MSAPKYYSAKKLGEIFERDPHTNRDWINKGCPTPDVRVKLQAVMRLIDKGVFAAIRAGATPAIPIDGMPVALRCCFEADPSRQLSTLHDAAAKLGCSPDELRARTADGEFQPVRVGRALRSSRVKIESRLRDEVRT